MAKRGKSDLVIWALAGVGAYLLFGRKSTAATNSSAATVQAVTANVGNTLAPPQLPALPFGQYWGQPPGWDAGPPSWQPVTLQQDGSWLATKPGTIAIPYVPMYQSSQQPGPTFLYSVTVLP